jgi:adenylate cyclase
MLSFDPPIAMCSIEAASADRRALERIEREITLRPDNANAMMRGAVTLAYLGEGERAKEWASRAL